MAASRDRLSPLPDEILLHILSFLHNTKERAQTSLLSRRFRHLWTYHPSLRLSIPFSISPDHHHNLSYHPDRYIPAVDHCLRSLRSPSLHSLSLDLWLPLPDYTADSRAAARTADCWLHFASTRSVRHLSLRAVSQPPSWDARIPPSLFSCHRSLTYLEISFSTFPSIPPNFPGFRSLKGLHLGCGFIDPDDLSDLLASCPVLERLKLIGCVGPTFVEISPRNLPNLVHLLLLGHDDWTSASIEAPNLKSIRFDGDLTSLAWKGSPVLDQATLRNKTGEAFGSLEGWMKIVMAVCNVRVLTVNYWFYQFETPKDFSRGPIFNNLKELNCNIDWVTGHVLQVITTNLAECPLLEELYINLNRDARFEVKYSVQAAHGEEPISTPHIDINMQNDILRQVEDDHEQDGCDPSDFRDLTYSFQHLKTVIFKGFLGTKNEMRLAEFLLGRAVALEEFIVFDFFWRDEDVLQQLFAPVARASSQVWMKLSMWENMNFNTNCYNKYYMKRL